MKAKPQPNLSAFLLSSFFFGGPDNFWISIAAIRDHEYLQFFSQTALTVIFPPKASQSSSITVWNSLATKYLSIIGFPLTKILYLATFSESPAVIFT
jgi:hypothetical protein